MNPIEKVNKGATVVLHTIYNECYIGRVRLILNNYNCIELDNVKEANSNEFYGGVQKYYKSEIQSITPIQSNVPSEESLNSSSLDESSNNDSTEFVNLTIEEMENVNQLITNYVYIYQTDTKYHQAIKDLQQQEIIAVNLEGHQNGRISGTSILVMSTMHCIYLFDIISLGQVFKELQIILESKIPRKICFNSSLIADNLKYRQNINMRSVFDIKVAYLASDCEKQVDTLEQCIAECFRLVLISDETFNWHLRPLADDQKTAAAQKCAYLYKLYFYLVNERLLKAIYAQSNTFSDCISSIRHIADVVFEQDKLQNECLNTVEKFELNLK